ncbi:2-methylaconitate cis-trans isomerase PrpF [Novispirillum itersonii]|uniref:2-methylaconitate cis-trans isomerase PrpF n=1 Tax=Novispirillum itersonii TaxID=189 RepID=A0A7X0DMK6_NOVIT|nr:2-methylaconitate cis-trans isomerase PrpF [Novispirillum itersonii]MBB6211188.1 hypothetical protein [Novispirillum itersonii]
MTPPPPQIRIPATYMRGGTSKGVFFRLDDLPERCRVPGPARDALLLRVLGSPDPYGKQTDGMGGATSSTSKAVILSRSARPDHDVDYLYGQVAIDRATVDWSGNCGNLTTAAGAFALHGGLVDPARLPDTGLCTVRIWQANIGRTILAHVPVHGGQVQETGAFLLDGVTFPAAEIALDFLDPAEDGEGASGLFPTGNASDVLVCPDSLVPGGRLTVTLITAGIPTIFVAAADLGYTGTETQDALNGDPAALARFEALRTLGALKMGLIDHPEQAATRLHTPKIILVAPPADYMTSAGKTVRADEIDLLARALSMGKLHHAMMGTAAIALAAAAAIHGTVVHQAAGGRERSSLCFGHPSGTLRVGAAAERRGDGWAITRASMSRSARILMEGWVRVPADCF